MNDTDNLCAPAVIGDGRLGRVLARALGAGAPLRRGESPAAGACAVILAVPDAAIAELAASLPVGTPIGHCSGALDARCARAPPRSASRCIR